MNTKKGETPTPPLKVKKAKAVPGAREFYEKRKDDPNLFQMRDDVAWMSAYQDLLIARSEAGDTESVRASALTAINMGDVEKAREILKAGVANDNFMRRIADNAKELILVKSRVAELTMRQEAVLTPLQSVQLFRSFIKITVEIAGAQLAQRIVAEIYKNVFDRQPKLALVNTMLAEGEPGGDS